MLLAVKTSWVYDAVRTGNLPCIRVGRHIRFTRAMLEEWLRGPVPGVRFGSGPDGRGARCARCGRPCSSALRCGQGRAFGLAPAGPPLTGLS